jgi:cell division protein FtsW
MAIVACGVVLVMAASPVVAERIGLPPFHFVNRQFAFLFLGLSSMFIFSMLPLVIVRRTAVICFLGTLLLLVAVQVFGAEVKGAKRWLFFGGFTLQPSEFVKPFFAVVTAWILARGSWEVKFPGYRISIGLYALVVFLLITQPDFGMTIAVSTVWGVQMFLAGLPLVWVIGIGVAGVGGAVSAYIFLPHVADRINTFLDPGKGDNYQVEKALEAFVNGGFFGVGPGQGVVKEVIPDSHTDFIFAVAGEEFGTLVCLLIVALFVFVVLRGFLRIYKEEDLFVVFASAGLLVQFAMQAIINMGVSLKLLPNTGMTLPLVSYGGSSTVAICITMGMILCFTRKRFKTRG